MSPVVSSFPVLKGEMAVSFDLHGFLKEYYEDFRKRTEDQNTPRVRELEWNVAYHLAPLDPPAAVERLLEFVENAAVASRLADVRGVLDLFEEQTQWLKPFEVERAYFQGRYAYARSDYDVAEDRFKLVWEKSEPSRIKAIAGHLLGCDYSPARSTRMAAPS